MIIQLHTKAHKFFHSYKTIEKDNRSENQRDAYQFGSSAPLLQPKLNQFKEPTAIFELDIIS